MKCSKCGAEIEAGSVFCKKCGEPVQMVPDYNILEDDFLISLLEEEKSAGKTEENQPETVGQNVQSDKRLPPVARVLLPLKGSRRESGKEKGLCGALGK